MKLTQPDLKIKCKVSHLNTLCTYLIHIIENHDEYMKTFVHNSTVRRIYRHHLNSVLQTVTKLIFNNAALYSDTKCTLKINEAQRLTLFEITCFYPLPMDINFIEYEIKNKLII